MGDEEVKSDVQEMNKAFDSAIETVEEINEDVKEEVIEDELEPDTEIKGEGTEEGLEEELKEEEIPAEGIEEGIEEEKEEEEPELDEKDKLIAELREKLAEKEVKDEPEPVVEPEPEPDPEPLTFEAQDFIDEDEDLEDLTRDPEKLNKVFNNIYQRAVTDTRKVLGEGVLRSIPDIVRASVDMMDKLKQMNNKFYSDNKDLEPFKKVVAAVFEEVATKNPGKDMMDLLPMVADDARKRLELHKQATKTTERKSPRLPSRKRRTTIPEEKPNTNPLLNELEEMNKTIRR